jgi:hypothetical protein
VAQAPTEHRDNMKRWGPLLFLLCLAGLAALYLHWQHPDSAANRWFQAVFSGTPNSTATTTTVPSVARQPVAAKPGSPATAAPVARGTLPPALAARVPEATAASVAPLSGDLTNLPPQTILENMRTTIRQYGSTLGGNPVGTNPEITSALQGDNPNKINFLKEDGNRVNSAGELVDFWGTPYFFHQLSGIEMEIRSAGPDKKMWTEDDLVIK